MFDFKPPAYERRPPPEEYMNFCNGSPILPSSSAHEEAQPARNRGTDHAENALVPHDVTAYRPLPRQAEMDTTVMLLDHLVDHGIQVRPKLVVEPLICTLVRHSIALNFICSILLTAKALGALIELRSRITC